MAQVHTTTNTTPLEYQTTLIERMATGYMFAMVKSSTADQYDLRRSIDNGASWSTVLSVTRVSIVEIGPICSLDYRYNQLTWCYRTNESSQDRIYLRTISDLNSPSWNSEVLLAAYPNGGVAGSFFSGMDIANYTVSGVLHYCVVAAGTVWDGNKIGVALFPTSGGTLASQVLNLNIVGGSNYWRFAGSGRSTPSIEIEHNGDGKTSTNPNLWVTFGRGQLLLVKCSWNGNGWTGPSNYVTIRTDLGADDTNPARWDGSRLIMCLPNPVSGQTDTVAVHERDRSNTTTVTRTTPVHPTGVVRNCHINYNSVNGDFRVYAIGTSTTVLYYVDFIRATSSWTTWAQVSATAVLGAAGNNWCVRRGTYSDAKHHVLTAHSGAPNTIVETAQALTYTPTAPTWVNTSGQAANVSASLLLDWNFNDPDPADVQSAYALSRQIGTGSLTYWRASDSTWQATEQKNTGSTSAVTLASGWALNSDANYTFKAKTWDSGDVASVYSSGLVVVPSALVNPSITQPTAAQVITTDHVTLTWTASEQTQYRIRLAIQGGATVYDSGFVTDSATRSVVVPYTLGDLTAWTLTLETKNLEGLTSTAQTRNFSVDYLEPMVPTLVVTPSTTNGYNGVAITNPAPTGSVPALTDQDLYRRVVGDVSNGIRIGKQLASGATFNDWKATGLTAYQYRAQAHGANGTSIYSAWTS